jgi:hypothetical protein
MHVGSLGDVVFETGAERVLTLSDMTRSREGRYEDHHVQGELPRPEFLSPDLSTVELTIRLFAGLVDNPVKESDKIGQYCKEGRVLRFIVAGWNLGNVTIRSYSQEWRHITPKGKGVQSIVMKLSLKEYV